MKDTIYLSKSKNGRCVVFLILCMLLDILLTNFDKFHFASLFIDISAILIATLFSYYGLSIIILWSFFTDISTNMPLGSNAIFHIILVLFCYRFRPLMIYNNNIRSGLIMLYYLFAIISCLLYRYFITLLCVSTTKIDINIIDIALNYAVFFLIIRYFRKKDFDFPDKFILIK